MEDNRRADLVNGDIDRWRGLEGLDPMFIKEVRLFIQHRGMYFFGMFDKRTMVWGKNDFGRLGLGEGVNKVDRPTEIMELRGKDMIKIVGGWAMAGLDDQGQVWGWAKNFRGGLGIGERNDEMVHKPKMVNIATKIIDIREGVNYKLALGEGGRVWGWGDSKLRQLGLDIEYSNVPIEIPGLKDIVQIDCCQYTSWALNRKGQVYRWGRRGGEIPILFEIEGSVRQITCTLNSTLFTTKEGQLYHCWINSKLIYTLYPCGTHNFISIISNDEGVFSARNEEDKIFTLFLKPRLEFFTSNYIHFTSPFPVCTNLYLCSYRSPHQSNIFSIFSPQSLRFTISVNSTLCPSSSSVSSYFDHSPSSNFTFHLPDGTILNLHKYHLIAFCPSLSHQFSTIWSNSSNASLKKLSTSTYKAYFRYLYTQDTSQLEDLGLIQLPSEIQMSCFIPKCCDLSRCSCLLYFPSKFSSLDEYSFEKFIKASKISLQLVLSDENFFTEIRSTLGVYRLNEEMKGKKFLGEGNFSQVTLAIIKDTDIQIAIKVLKNYDKDILMKEVKAASFLVHSNIVRFFGVLLHAHSEILMMSFEYMEQGSLDKYLYNHHPKYKKLETRELSLFDRQYMSSQLARAVSFIHTKGYIHCDLAARNCLVSAALATKVCDLGLAREISKKNDSLNETETNYYRAKYGAELPYRWMSPECIKDKIFTTQTDCWSFGVLLWEIMSYGCIPHYENSDIKEIQDGKILERPNDCPENIYKLMKECWKIDPSKRITMQEIKSELSNLL